MSNRSARPLKIRTEPCRALSYLVTAVHGLALLALFLPMHLPLAVRAVIGTGVVLSLVRYARACRAPTATILWRGPGQWFVIGKGEEPRVAMLSPHSVVTPWLVILGLRVDRERWRYFILCRTACDDDAFRRLRVALRYGAFTADRGEVSARW